MKLPLAAVLGLFLGACSTPRPLAGGLHGTPREASVHALATGSLEANWKERLAQPYVFLEKRGDYRELGDTMRTLLTAASELGLASKGPPFALFYDDPGRVQREELRARVCLPVAERPSGAGALRYDVLPRAMVVYAEVRGPYPELARSYPLLFAYLGELGWQAGAPIREVYLVNPSEVAGHGELVAEVQIPWSAGE
jgi:effector-binding domain-containing protein